MLHAASRQRTQRVRGLAFRPESRLTMAHQERDAAASAAQSPNRNNLLVQPTQRTFCSIGSFLGFVSFGLLEVRT